MADIVIGKYGHNLTDPHPTMEGLSVSFDLEPGASSPKSVRIFENGAPSSALFGASHFDLSGPTTKLVQPDAEGRRFTFRVRKEEGWAPRGGDDPVDGDMEGGINVGPHPN